MILRKEIQQKWHEPGRTKSFCKQILVSAPSNVTPRCVPSSLGPVISPQAQPLTRSPALSLKLLLESSPPIPVTPLFCLPPQAMDLLHCASLEQVISIHPPPWRASSTATCPRISASVGRGPPFFKRNAKRKQNPRNNFPDVF